MLVIGTCAYPGSGQDVLADTISENEGMTKVSIGDYLRKEALQRGIVPNRKNLQDLRKHFDSTYGRSYFPSIIAREIISNSKNVIITGIRCKEEYQIFRKQLNLYLIFVYADFNTRALRVLKRGELKDPKTIEDFIKQEQAEKVLFDLPFLNENADLIFDCSNEWLYYQNSVNDRIINKIPILRNEKQAS